MNFWGENMKTNVRILKAKGYMFYWTCPICKANARYFLDEGEYDEITLHCPICNYPIKLNGIPEEERINAEVELDSEQEEANGTE